MARGRKTVKRIGSRARPARRNAPSLAGERSRTAGSLAARLARVKLFLCDVDGVLTDGGLLMGGGVETKRFNIRDGLGLRLLQREGIKVGWISNRPSLATTQRAENLKIDYLHQADGDKVIAVEAILARAGASWGEICYLGDDIVDLGVLKRAGVSIAVANGIAETKAVADYVTRARGGEGAVREVVELILKAQNKWERLAAFYLA
jgi:3-deoxy-D-manno-octulosonate 8-phosphate phosphatase (KDO 8-P phosphatase)